MMPTLLSLAFAVPATPPPTDPLTPRGHTTATPAEVANYIAAGTATLVDVRERPEWDEGHLEAATLVPLSEIAQEAGEADFQKRLFAAVPKDRPVYTHCKAGGRCVQAADPLRVLGYDVRPIPEGFAELVEFGFATADDEK